MKGYSLKEVALFSVFLGLAFGLGLLVPRADTNTISKVGDKSVLKGPISDDHPPIALTFFEALKSKAVEIPEAIETPVSLEPKVVETPSPLNKQLAKTLQDVLAKNISQPTEPPKLAKPNHPFRLQVGSYPTRKRAIVFEKKLRRKGYKPLVIEAKVGGGLSVFRVQLLGFHNYQSALAAKKHYESTLKKSAFIIEEDA